MDSITHCRICPKLVKGGAFEVAFWQLGIFHDGGDFGIADTAPQDWKGGCCLLKRWVCPLTCGHSVRLIRRQWGESNEAWNSHQLYTKAIGCNRWWVDSGRKDRQSDILTKKIKGKKLVCKFSCDNCLEWNGQAGKERELARNKRRSS